MAMEGTWIRRGTKLLTVIASCAAIAAITIFVLVRNVPTPGDIFSALTAHPSAYTLSLGHMQDLTLQSLAYLRVPLLLVTLAFLVGAVGTFRADAKRAFVSSALMMLLFFQAARLALVTFDPDLSSRPLAEAILRSPEGKLIVDRHYYTFSSIVFYTNRPALLLNGRALNLSYGSYAPGAPNVFIDDAQFKELWATPERYYLVANTFALPRLERLVGQDKLNIVAQSGGKFVATNIPLASSVLPPAVHAQRLGASEFRQISALRSLFRHPARRLELALQIPGLTRGSHLAPQLRRWSGARNPISRRLGRRPEQASFWPGAPTVRWFCADGDSSASAGVTWRKMRVD